MNSSWLRSKVRSIRRLTVAAGTVCLIFCGAAGAAPQIADEDLLALLSLSLGGRDLAAVAWANMNLSEKQTLRDQAARIASMAEAAERDGLPASDDVRLALKWGTQTLLADAWKKKVEADADLSEEALRAFYRDNLPRYFDEGSVRYHKVVYTSKQKDVASRVKSQLKKAPLKQLKDKYVAVGWSGFDKLDPSWAEALREAPLEKVMGPIRVPEGYALFEVIERREEGPLPFEECADRVREDLIQTVIRERLF